MTRARWSVAVDAVAMQLGRLTPDCPQGPDCPLCTHERRKADLALRAAFPELVPREVTA